jgi:hypothetical protein
MASSGRLNPGEKGKIIAKIAIKGRKGFMSKNLQVFTNDPGRPVITLNINAFIPQ